MNRGCTNEDWSDGLNAMTRNAIENLNVLCTPDGSLCLKHIGGAFGTISLGNLLSGKFQVIDRETGAESVFQNVDALIAVGWAID
jgi:hypothetical protein